MDTQTNLSQATDWKAELTAKLPYLGHRNWIVITDMAYPLQSGSGITTLYADEPYEQVLKQVKQMIDAAPHVFAHTYCDKELGLIPEADMPGVTAFREKAAQIYGNEVVPIPHEQLIARLDEAGKLFNVVIVKTPLTMAYTSTFFELDCNYWSADRQQRLDDAMKQ
ncbi:MAG: RbsD/FucU domain-containing protein [Bacteroidales bacterium]|nr:RbsD/FucU domain-containing protein [Bacteroidales bacterium]